MKEREKNSRSLTASLSIEGALGQDQAHELRKIVEMQQRTIRILRGSLTDSKKKLGVQQIVEIKAAFPKKNNVVAVRAVKQGGWAPHWSATQLPPNSIEPVPGFACATLAKARLPSAAISVFGREGEDLEWVLSLVADRQLEGRDFVPVFLTNAVDNRVFRRYGFAFAYFSTRLYAHLEDVLASSRYYLIARKWAFASYLDLGKGATVDAQKRGELSRRRVGQDVRPSEELPVLRGGTRVADGDTAQSTEADPVRASGLFDEARPAAGADKKIEPGRNPAPLYRSFDDVQERAFLAILNSKSARVQTASENSLASIVIPVLREGTELRDAVQSALRQTHQNLEVILVDGGCSDGFLDQIKSDFSDARLKLVHSESPGIGAARNTGLKATSGTVVAYLDPECTWRPEFLDRMICWLVIENVRCGYCVSQFRDDDRIFGYRGEQFDRAAYLRTNYVDLNTFCHLRSLYDERGGFDEGCDFSAWDLILRYSENERVAFAPFIGCEYGCLRVAIKIDSPRAASQDRSSLVAVHLAQAFRRLGREARIDYRSEWYSREATPSELVIVLRGSLAYEPQQGQFTLLWSIGDLGRISFEEMDASGLVVVGLETDASFLRTVIDVPVLSLSSPFGLRSSGDVRAESVGGARIDLKGLATCARTILENVRELFGRDPTGAPDSTSARASTLRRTTRRKRARVHVIRRVGARVTQSSPYIRLISPLTSDVASDVLLSTSVENSIDGAAESDVCIVSCDALDDGEKISLLLEQAQRSGTRIIVDNDDAFGLVNPADPYFEAFSERDTSMRLLMESAEQCWFSTTQLADVYRQHCASVRVIPNTLDLRIWTSPLPSPNAYVGDRLRFLYMGTARHGSDLALIMPAFEAIAEKARGEFELTVVGVAGDLPPRPWLTKLPAPPSVRAYPRFVRWLIRQGPFDVGLAPLESTPFNACKSDIKFLDYSAMGLLSVVSDVPAYGGDAKSLELAVVVQNTTETWKDAFEQLIGDPKKYAAAANAAHRYVREKRNAALAASVQLKALWDGN